MPSLDEPGYPPKFRALGSFLITLVVGLLPCGAGVAQDNAPPSDGPAEVRGSIEPSPATDAEHQLQSLQADIEKSDAARRKLETDIQEARTDRLRFNAALIDTTARVRDAQSKVAETSEKLTVLGQQEAAIRKSLEDRRGVIAEVLASLQRMGRKPPPAIVVRPEDILTAIRTAILLGSVIPELRDQAQTLAADLSELTRVRNAMNSERDTLAGQLASLDQDSQRLQGLIEARQKAQASAEADLGEQTARAADLARQAGSLKDLIGRLESGVSAARKAADAAKAAEAAQRTAAEADAASVQNKVAAGIFHDPARLQPAVSFADTKGLLPLPLHGHIVKTFGQPDGFGGSEKGLSLAAQPKAIVTAPADGWVAFSGPYRTYGQVLILNLGGGYYNVLAGMDHVDVAPGQFVLAGEPVGVMGDGSVKTAAAYALGASEPVLYVELRKDGAAIDPSPWWAKAALEKVRG